MSKLYFYYSAMNAGKSTVLLQASYNYQERGMRTLLFAPVVDQRAGIGRIASRIGLEAEANPFSTTDDLYKNVIREHETKALACVLIDEAQFLTRAQVEQLCRIVDELNLPVLCYGLRTDFQAQLFPGSAALLALADNLIELKTICDCGRKATMNLRVNEDGKGLKEGEQIEIGGNERYVAMCRRHYHEALAD